MQKQHGKASLENSLADSSKFSFFYLLKDTAKEMKRNPIDRKEIFYRHTVSDKGPVKGYTKNLQINNK